MQTAAGLPLPSLSRGRFPYAIPNHIVPDFASGSIEGEVLAYTDEALFEACGTRIAFTERGGGVSVGAFASLNTKDGLGDSQRAVQLNRLAICSAFGDPLMQLLSPNQVHGANIIETCDPTARGFSHAYERGQAGADAITVGCVNLAALLSFADCVPLIYVAPTGAFSVVHCGWRGVASHLAARAVESLCDTAECAPGSINVYIGPYIHQECFDVSADTAEIFKQEFGPEVVYVSEDGSTLRVDLGQALRMELVREGIAPERIADVGICTVCENERFFSYRAQNGVCGRHGAFAVRLGE